MKKTISVVALDPRAGSFYAQEIQELFGESVAVASYSVRDGSAMGVLKPADLFCVSTDAFDSSDEVGQHVPFQCQVMGIEVSYRWSAIHRLREIPKGTKALFVNMTLKMAREAITQLEHLGVNHLELIPFYPGAALREGQQMDIAVTPDEERYVPPGMQKVLNLGHRSCTSGMMIEIALRLGLEHLLETREFQSYFCSMATNDYTFDQMLARSTKLESRIDILMEILDEGLIGVNEKGEIFACNQKAQEITRASASLIRGKWCEDVFPYIPFSKCLQTRTALPPQIIRISGINVNLAVTPVLHQQECIGAFATLQRFNDMEKRQNELRSQIFHKGHQAKYTFEDIVGQSEAICRTKEILKRMAATQSPVLLIGETGTGKELFAHAIHSASQRSACPFVAINVAAISENLLESELFGYEEGAFTGAKKGGRPGLFEFAHTGTLFLDEVEGMSPAMQVKLLRVLQEQEIMRVGGHQIIHVDVRIIAATNEALEEKVADGSFRKDLYYRISALPALIPPLRERGEDVFLLLQKFAEDMKGNFQLSEPVKRLLETYSWPGNIRELHNVAEYFSYTGSQVILPKDLPPTFHQHMGDGQGAGRENPAPWRLGERGTDGCPSPKFWFVLRLLYEAAAQGRPIGREGILSEARQSGLPLSQKEVRQLLREMDAQGLAKVGPGRGGSKITVKGQNMWEQDKMNGQGSNQSHRMQPIF